MRSGRRLQTTPSLDLPHPIPSLVGSKGHCINPDLDWPRRYRGCFCFSAFLVFPSSLHPCPLRVASQLLPLLEVACISTHTGRGLWGGSDPTRLHFNLKKPHLCFWLCHKKGLVVAVPSAWTPEPGKQGRATPIQFTVYSCHPPDLQIHEQWNTGYGVVSWQQSLTDTTPSPLCFSSLLEEGNQHF